MARIVQDPVSIGVERPRVVARAGARGAPRSGPAGRLALWTRRRPFDALALAFLLTLAAVALVAPAFAPQDPVAQDMAARLHAPSAAHWMGTDQLGRDVLSRVLYAARLSVVVGLAAVALGAGIGGTVGVISGTAGGWWDTAAQRVVDILMSFPLLVLALAVIAAAGASVQATVLALGVAYAPLAARMTRSVALSERTLPYVESARAIGASPLRVMLRHVAPACAAPWLVLVSAEVGGAMLAEASLSFLGLGAQEPMASLGGMIGGAALMYVEQAPWLALWPGLALAALVLAFNLAGDALRDALDPRERGG